MKYKIIGFATFLVAALMILFMSLCMSEDNGQRYIQHIHAEAKEPCIPHQDNTFCTHLPLISIDTNGIDIPGKPVHNHELSGKKYTVAADGSSTITATVSVVDNVNTNNHPGDPTTIQSSVRIRIRGNSSRHFDKEGYDIEFINADGTNNPLEVMGMDAHHEWALHGPFLDKTLIRNYLWYSISGQLMDYAPNVRFCELVLNGEYRGVYLMCETISAGKNSSRISLDVDKKNNTFTGYILRHDRGSNNEVKNIEPFSVYTYHTNRVINIVSPGTANLNEELARNISLDFSEFEKALYSYDFDDKKHGYFATIDINSFVDYFLINEVSLNRDAGIYSTYIYNWTSN